MQPNTEVRVQESPDSLVPDMIAPEGLQIAECYLKHGGDSKLVALELELPAAQVDLQLKKPEVKGYISRIFNEAGFRNKSRMFGLLDQIVNMKLEEMADTGLGTTMDIMDVLKTYQTMQINTMKMEMDLLKAQKENAPVSQTNIQVNQNLPGSSDPAYMDVLNLLTGGKK